MMTMYISPNRRLSTMRQMMDRMIDETLTETAAVEREMLLAVDVQTDDEGYLITALVPGMEAEDLDLEVINNTVTIRGEFKSSTQEDFKYLLCELPNGHFSRSITLPTALDANKTDATIRNGVLTLSVPKAEAHRPKAIKVVSK